MELDEVIRARRMVRRYSDEPVDPAVVERALGRAVRAPSAGFTQGWAFLVLDRPADVVAFWTAATPPGRGTDAWSSGMRRAPVVVVPWSSQQAYLDRYAEPDKGWSDDGTGWPVPYWHVDAGMAAMLMLLSVVDDGLGASSAFRASGCGCCARPSGFRSPTRPSGRSPSGTPTYGQPGVTHGGGDR
jgi:nitroreductase